MPRLSMAVIIFGDEFPRRLCDPLPSVTAVLYYRWLATGLHDKIISQGVGGQRVYVGIRHPIILRGRSAEVTQLCKKKKVRHQKVLEAYQAAYAKYTRDRTKLLDWIETNFANKGAGQAELH